MYTSEFKILFSLIITLFLYVSYKNNSLEKMTSSGTPTQQDIVSQENLLAIKNLGLLAGNMISQDGGTLTLPYNLTVNNLNVNSSARFGINSGRQLKIINSSWGKWNGDWCTTNCSSQYTFI